MHAALTESEFRDFLAGVQLAKAHRVALIRPQRGATTFEVKRGRTLATFDTAAEARAWLAAGMPEQSRKAA